MDDRKLLQFIIFSHVGRFPAFSFSSSPHPEKPSIDRCYQIIDIDTEVCIQPRFVIDEDVDSRHDDACYPKIYTCLVLQPKVEKSYKCSDDFESLLHNKSWVPNVGTFIIKYSGVRNAGICALIHWCLPVRHILRSCSALSGRLHNRSRYLRSHCSHILR